MIHRRQFLISALAASAGLSVVPTTLRAADYPNRVIRLVVPFAAGGGVDVFARLLAEKLKETRRHLGRSRTGEALRAQHRTFET
jgi:tripartite-type tricarboxylate transporter receptor subunit TctC